MAHHDPTVRRRIGTLAGVTFPGGQLYAELRVLDDARDDSGRF
jgi:hypothetical protein